MEYCSFRQSSLREVSLVLEADSEVSVAYFSAVEYYSHPSNSIMLCQIVYSAR